MMATEVKEIKERIANLRSSQATGCDQCNNGVVYIETENWGIEFKQCPYCNQEEEK